MALRLQPANAMTNTDGLPHADPDSRITRGTLLLWEPAHPADAFVGVPTAPALNSGATITTPMPNIAKRAAAALMGVSEAATRPNWTRNDGAGSVANNDMIHERSAKGGLHVITSQATMIANRASGLDLPQATKTWIYNHLNHEYALDVIRDTTRVDATNGGPHIALMRNSGATTGMFSIGRAGQQGITGVTGQAVPIGGHNSLGLTQVQVANTWDGAAPANDGADMIARLFGFGTVCGAYGDHGYRKSMSAVIYSVILEDLTESGRTRAEFFADCAARRAADFAVGGFYNGDTHSAVSILP